MLVVPHTNWRWLCEGAVVPDPFLPPVCSRTRPQSRGLHLAPRRDHSSFETLTLVPQQFVEHFACFSEYGKHRGTPVPDIIWFTGLGAILAIVVREVTPRRIMRGQPPLQHPLSMFLLFVRPNHPPCQPVGGPLSLSLLSPQASGHRWRTGTASSLGDRPHPSNQRHTVAPRKTSSPVGHL